MLKKSACFLILVCFFISEVQSQSINTPFGKNRVQYHNNFKYWWVYETQNFKTYWYDVGKFVGVPTLQLAELDFKEIQDVLEHRMNDKIEIVVYSDISDLKMSNIGLEETFITVSGQTKVDKNKVFVYFDGNHNNLRKQIRQGVAEVFINSMLYGSSFQEVVQNAVMYNVPDWYISGISKYIESDWDEISDDQLRDLLTRNKRKYKSFNRLSKDFPQLAGHSFWKFIGDTYGKSSISNLLYLTRINKNMKSAFIYVLGVPFKQLYKDWYIHFMQQYKDINPTLSQIDESKKLNVKIKKRQTISNIKVSNDGNFIAYATNKIGRVKVYIHDLKEDKGFQVLKYGIKNPLEDTDYGYPILAWNENGEELTIIYEVRDIIKHRRIDLSTDEITDDLLAPEYRRVFGADYINDSELVLSATTDGFSDLYKYNFDNRQSERITNDFYDDLDVKTVTLRGTKGLLFASNRNDIFLIERKLDTILPIDKFDILFLPLDEGTKKLFRISKTPAENDRQPVLIDENHVAYLSGGSGIINRKIAKIESLDALPQANYHSNEFRNINHQDAENNTYVYVQKHNRKDHLFLNDYFQDSIVSPSVTQFKRINKGLKSTSANLDKGSKDVVHIKSSKYIDPSYYFQTEFGSSKEKNEKEENVDFDFLAPSSPEKKIVKNQPAPGIIKFINSRATAARLRFRLDDVTSRLDNSVLFEGLDSYAGDRQDGFQPQPFGYLIKAEVKDIFEDYEFQGGVRIPTTLNGTEVFLTFDDKKKRIDKKYALYRRSISERSDQFANPNESIQKNTTIALYQWKYPFDYFTSVRASLTYRIDRFFDKVSEFPDIDTPSINGQRIGLKLEYIYDSSFDVELNIKNGIRYKFYIEGVNSMNIDLIPPLAFQPSKGFMTVIGADFRHYTPIGKYAVWANRVAAATNFGSENTLYYIGGMESWIRPVFNQETPTPPNNYAYSAVAPHLRGFNYNTRNGTTFALYNSEVRFPIFNMLSSGRIKYKFIRNFQLTGFLDAGLAWHGLTPYSDENVINTLTLESPPTVKVNVKYFRDPLILGYGIGARTSLFGYFVKVDYAWGVETRIIQKPKLYLSFGMDF